MSGLFQARRDDGRSDATVIRELVAGREPGAILTFDDLRQGLKAGTAGVNFTPSKIGAAVRSANRQLLRQQQRVLHSVPRVGYRLALAKEFSGLATLREVRANRQIATALLILSNVRWDEMDPEQAKVHQAHLQITSAVVKTQEFLLRRQAHQDSLITDLVNRVGALEANPSLMAVLTTASSSMT